MKRRIWLITDTHFNHKELIPDCGRPENFEKLIYKGLNLIGEKDILVHLGDICVGGDRQVHEDIIKPLKFTKILVRGNHDGKSDNWYLNHGWDFVCERFQDTYFGKRILFSHMPIAWNEDYDINIHGHFHNINEKYHEPELKAIKNSYQTLLAVEYTEYEPVLLEKFLQEKNLID